MITAWAYMVAIVAANISVSTFGPASAPINAFLLIGALLTLRDRLHDQFGPAAVYVLVVFGTCASLALGPDVARIAVGGALAFTLSELCDTAVYHALRHRPWGYRVNVSNVAGAAVDSLVFFPAAFGTFPVWLIGTQFVAKVGGGAVWAFLLIRFFKVDKHPKRGVV